MLQTHARSQFTPSWKIRADTNTGAGVHFYAECIFFRVYNLFDWKYIKTHVNSLSLHCIQCMSTVIVGYILNQHDRQHIDPDPFNIWFSPSPPLLVGQVKTDGDVQGTRCLHPSRPQRAKALRCSWWEVHKITPNHIFSLWISLHVVHTVTHVRFAEIKFSHQTQC